MWVIVHTGYQARKDLHTGTVKLNIDPHKFCHVAVIYLRFTKKNLFLCGKTKKLKIAILTFFKQ